MGSEREELLETAQSLWEIKQELQELVNQARRLVRPTSEGSRARVYWLAHLETALDSHSRMSMQDSIRALEEEAREMLAEEMDLAAGLDNSLNGE